ncbi:glucosaminidase domain-containing protein [Marinomonas epiphytica]
MERKILWFISFVLILILWIKVQHSQSPEETLEAPTVPTEQEQVKPEDKTEKLSSDVAKAASPRVEKNTSDTEEDTSISEEEKAYFASHPTDGSKPDFAAIKDVQERKDAFFGFLKPFIDEKNTLTRNGRERLQAWLQDDLDSLSKDDVSWLNDQMKSHKLEVKEAYQAADLHALLKRLDIIPASLVLAQAANESAWGTSRFATLGNNFFGQWCFRKGCGLVPESRDADADHEVRKFKNVRESVFAYIDNLNRNGAYKELRNTRYELRQQQQEITGLLLADGLLSYSERGEAYIDEIKGMIDYNKLWRYNDE